MFSITVIFDNALVSWNVRTIPWWAAGLSIIATETSALTFIGAPVQSMGLTAYSFEIQGADGEGARNWQRGLGALVVMGAGLGLLLSDACIRRARADGCDAVARADRHQRRHCDRCHEQGEHCGS